MSLSYNPSTLTKGVRAEFLRAAAAAPKNLVDRIASRIQSGASSETYAWVGDSPQMEALVDEINFKTLSDTSYSVANVEYASGIAIKRKELMDDQTGGIMMRIRQMASVAMSHPDSLLIAALDYGTTGLCYDGVSMFNDTHPIRNGESATQDNLLAGTGTGTSNVATDINTALTFFGNVKAENGEAMYPQGVRRLGIVAPWGLRKAFLEACTAGSISATDNVQVDGLQFDFVFDGRLSDANDWYALNLDVPTRGLIFQEREALRFEALESGDAEFTRSEYKYKCQARYAVGYGPWQAACKFVNT